MKLFAFSTVATAAIAQSVPGFPDYSTWFGKTKYTCPDYQDIRQESVNGFNFDIDEFAGHWYLAATNEPTIPPICKCPVNDVTVDKEAGEYKYTCSLECTKPKHFSITMKGELSKDT